MHEIVPFSIPSMRSFVPEKLRPWIVIVFVIIFQLSSGVYLAAVSEMTGSTALMQEDILMAGYASLAGMSLTFALMFRLKFRFTPKTSLLVCSAAVLTGNLICMYTLNIPLLVATCFFTGIFRMWGTFECNSTLQLWLTPKRDLSVFFCYIYLLVQGCMQLSGVLTVYAADQGNWESMHWLIIALLTGMMIAVLVLYRNHRPTRKLPLYGIDWLGAILWAVTLLCVLFVCVYGEHYEWYDSRYIRQASWIGVVALGLNLWRASFIRHPFISLKTWRYQAVYTTFLLLILIDFLLAPSHLFEEAYLVRVLGYDSLNVVSLNWIILLGVTAGGVFSYATFARLKWRYKSMTVIALLAITGYLMMFYFTIDYNLPKEALLLPLFLRSFGYVIIAVCFLTALSSVPFEHFFEAVSVQAFISAACGSAVGTAVLGHLLTVTMKKNAMLLGATLDRVHPLASRLPEGELYGILQQQAFMVSVKELSGWLALLSLACLILFCVRESSIRPVRALHPPYRLIRRYVKHELRMRKKAVPE